MTTRRARSDALRNRERVMDVARRLFEEKGPDVEIDEVARVAGVGVGTIYRQFPNKDALIQGVLWSHVQPLATAGLEKAEAADPGAAFYEHMAFLADAFLAKENVHLALAKAGVQHTGAAQRDAMTKSLTKLLARAQEAGAVRDDIGPKDLLLLIRGTLFPAHGGIIPKRTRRRLFDVVLQGLRPRV